MTKLSTILSTFTKTKTQLENFCSKNYKELEAKKTQVQALESDQAKAQKVLKNINAILEE